MIARIESHRKRPLLNEACVLFHRLATITSAWEHARALGNYPLADVLLADRDALVARIRYDREERGE